MSIVREFLGDDLKTFARRIRKYIPRGGGFPASLSADTTVGLQGIALDFNLVDGGSFYVKNTLDKYLTIESSSGQQKTQLISFNDDNTSFAELTLYGNTDDGISGALDAFDNDSSIGTRIKTDAQNNINTYQAATHSFTGNVGIGVLPTDLLDINDGTNNLLTINATGFSSQLVANDNTSISSLILNADTGDPNVNFGLHTSNGGADVSIIGDAGAQTIALSAANGFSMDGGNSFYQWNAPSAGAPDPADSTIFVIINGTGYNIAATIAPA